MGTTTDSSDPDLQWGEPDRGPVGQNKKYLVLSDEERNKGFIRPVRKTYVHNNCGGETTIAMKIAETYARDPKFYGQTYCCSCQMHRPVGEFVWLGTDLAVGS